MNDLEKALKVPYLPEDIPFNGEQKRWLGGFLAGLHTRLIMKEDSDSATTPALAAPVETKPLLVAYGTQTGNAQMVAEDIAEQAKEHGLLASIADMDDLDPAQLAASERLLVVTSTYGEGEMPDNAEMLWEAMNDESAPSFANTHYSVLALGDTNYDDFCLAGIQWDQRLAELGGQRVVDRVDCDVEFEEPSAQWMAEVLPLLATKGSGVVTPPQVGLDKNNGEGKKRSQYNRQNPLLAELTTKRALTDPDSSKQVYHYELSLAGSGEHYEAGDALNVIACNSKVLVEELLSALKADGDQPIHYNNQDLSLTEVFTEYLEIRNPSKEFIAELALRAGDAELTAIVSGDQGSDALNDFLWGKDTVDLLKQYQTAEFSIAEFIALLKPLAPRAYSISSSINQHPEQVHLTVGNVRYNSQGRDHNGVCSGFLADTAEIGDKVKCFFSANKNFAVPSDGNAPMIMVGPGTGIAPFRAFLEERDISNASGDNWLFFGDRNSKTDFLYQQELTAMQETGLLTRLDLAFSRDQAEKIYVQDRMLAEAEALFSWLERGGFFFVCGDAYRMAKDVDKALHTIVEQQGKLTSEQAIAYVNQLKKEKRYVRDVY